MLVSLSCAKDVSAKTHSLGAHVGVFHLIPQFDFNGVWSRLSLTLPKQLPRHMTHKSTLFLKKCVWLSERVIDFSPIRGSFGKGHLKSEGGTRNRMTHLMLQTTASARRSSSNKQLARSLTKGPDVAVSLGVHIPSVGYSDLVLPL